ncbi:uncharacterized protein LOC131669344 [Phymastichus coffea]|uniref:uncharacterized protein LOC131669344 n=1 Tax=Phymastichus coffea TaxID=108790 RepID=UPI00273CD385|nr:uncharacterized protein LOC131669344 [Phymastichus coffea]
MTQFKKCSRPELLFLEFDIDDLKGPNLPTNGDMLRYYFNRRHALPTKSNRSVVRMTLSKCFKIWNDNEIPTTTESNGIKYLEQILLKFNRMKNEYKNASKTQRQRKINMWRHKYELLFSIATRDAHEKCSAENREKLLIAKKEIKEFNTAVKSNAFIRTTKPMNKSSKEVMLLKDAKFNNCLMNHDKTGNNSNPVSSGTKVKHKPKTFRQLNNDAVMSSPNQILREQLKQQGWVYIKKKPTWKLAVVAPPSNLLI